MPAGFKIAQSKSDATEQLFEKEISNLKALLSKLENENLKAKLIIIADQLVNAILSRDPASKKIKILELMKNELKNSLEIIDFPLLMQIHGNLSLFENIDLMGISIKDANNPVEISLENDLIKKINTSIQRREFAKTIEFLQSNTRFNSIRIMRMSNGKNPLIIAILMLMLHRFYQALSREMIIDIKRIIYLLRENGCLLPFNIWGREDSRNPNFGDEQNFLHCLLLLENENFEMDLKENITSTSIWSQNPPPKSSWNNTSFCETDFHNVDLDPMTYEKVRDYFIKVSHLFSNESMCLKYLEIIDKKLSETGFFLDLNKVTPAGYLGTRFFNFPVPPATHTPTKKFQKLRKMLVSLLQYTSEHPEINLLPSGDFWDIYGFIEPKLAKELALKGELFWDKRHDVTANIHGSAAHPLQIAILVLAHLSGECVLPENMTMRDILKYAFSIKIRLKNQPIWQKIFDMAYDQFSSPQFIQTIVMGPLGEKHCPHLCAYMRDSFWRHYQISREKHQLPVESQILFDFFFYSLFLGEIPLNYSVFDLQQRYRDKGVIAVAYKNGLDTIFKKESVDSTDTKITEDIGNTNSIN